MAARIRAHDWAATPLGPVGGWPQSLKTAVDVVLAMPGPATVLWGPAHVQIYNDAYVAIARDRHPALLGRPAAEGWPDAYAAVVAPLLEAARAGRATRLAGVRVALRGPGGAWEERAFDTDWSPLRDEAGAVAGALQTLTEATDRARAEAALRESEARFRALVTATSDVVYSMSPDWAEMRRLHGQGFLADTEAPRRDWLDAYIHPDDQPAVLEAIGRAVRGREVFALEHRVRRADGTLGWTSSRAVPMLDERGEILDWFGAARDVTARREDEARRAFLLGLSDTLRPLADPAAIKAAAARVLGRHLRANRAFYAEVEGGDWVVSDPYEQGAEPRAEGRHPMAAFGPWIPEMLRRGERLVVRDLDADPRFDPSERAAHAAYRIAGAVAVPLVKGGELAAVLVVHSAVPRAWTDPEVALVEETAERTWAAVERARAEAALRESEERSVLLVRFSDEVRGLSDPARVAEAAGRILMERLGTDSALWAVIDWETREYVVEWVVRADGARTEPSRWPLDPRDPFAAEHLAGRAVAYDDSGDDPRIPAPAAAAMAGRGLRAGIAAPVMAAGTLRAVLNTSQPAAPRRWRPEEVALAEALAGRAWAEVERARAEAALREREERQAFLLTLSDTLRGETDERRIERVALDLLAEQLSVDRAYITTSDYGKGETVVPAEVRRGELPALVGTFRHSDFPESARLVNEGTLVIEDVGKDAQLSEPNRRSFEAIRIGALIGVGLRKGVGDIF